jgi:ATP-dependent Clp protease, protease subunit
MIHQPSGGIGGQATDIEIVTAEIKKLRTELYDILALHSGQTVEQIAKDSDRDKWMSSTEAKEYGLIDEVLLVNPRKQQA